MKTCEYCAGYGIKYVKAGVPNLITTCPDCKGIGGTTRFVDWASEIATLAHRGQYRRDRHGNPTNEAYIHHPKRIADKFDDWPAAQAAAWLHDVLEDNKGWTRLKLEVAGIPQDVIEAVESMTKGNHEDYGHYLAGLKNNSIARAVKIRDIIDNLASDPTEGMIRKYADALFFLVLEDV
jgi:(p)ppGpp synthase/HD superfamily hydrolase